MKITKMNPGPPKKYKEKNIFILVSRSVQHIFEIVEPVEVLTYRRIERCLKISDPVRGQIPRLRSNFSKVESQTSNTYFYPDNLRIFFSLHDSSGRLCKLAV